MTLILALLKQYWKPLAILAIVGVFYARVTILKHERDEAINDLNAYKEKQAILAKEQADNVARIKAQGISDLQANTSQHIKDVQFIASKYVDMINQAKGEHEQLKIQSQTDIDTLRNQLADSLQQQSSSNSISVPNDDTNRPASDNSNRAIVTESEEYWKTAYSGCEAYVQTLEAAGAMCASDYNMCKSYVDSQQKLIGVSK